MDIDICVLLVCMEVIRFWKLEGICKIVFVCFVRGIGKGSIFIVWELVI